MRMRRVRLTASPDEVFNIDNEDNVERSLKFDNDEVESCDSGDNDSVKYCTRITITMLAGARVKNYI